MKRIDYLAFFALATFCALRSADAKHSGRPAKLPDLTTGTVFSYKDSDGDVFASEALGINTVAAFDVYGWGFDPNDPNSPFEASSPAFTSSDPQQSYSGNQFLLLYNGSVLTLSNVHKQRLTTNPNQSVGPGLIQLYDSSRLVLKESVVGDIFLRDASNASLTDTKIDVLNGGAVEMRSSGTLTMKNVTSHNFVGTTELYGVIASNGTTLLENSTASYVDARDNASVTITNSTIREGLSTETGGSPTVTVTGSTVGKISGGGGSISISGGEIKGLVQAFGNGSVAVSGLTIPGGVTAVGNGLVNLSGSQVNGSLAAGSDLVPSKTSHIFMSGGTVQGHAEVIGYGTIDLIGVSSVGAGSGTAASASDFATLNIFDTPTIKGGVTLEGNSSLVLSNVGVIQGPFSASSAGKLGVEGLTQIAGDLTVSGKAKLSVQGSTNISGGVVVREEGSLELSGGNSQFAFVENGTLKLNNVDVTQSIAAHGSSHLTFGGGSRTGGTIFNVGTQEGLVSVTGGLVTGNLAGVGSSITAMSGGRVRGFPLFQGGATFSYSGGTFDFFGIPQATAAVGDEEGPVVLEPLKGFAAIEDAEIQFIGRGLQSTLIDPNFVYGDSTYSVYQLTGRLADGTLLDGGLVYTQNGATARFQLIEAPVPEPSTMALSLLVVAAMSGCCRRSF